NHAPKGPPDLDLDSSLFELGARGTSGNISAGTTEMAYPSVRGNTSPTVGQDILCGLNVRFGVDPSLNICGMLAGSQFIALGGLFNADPDRGEGMYADTSGLEDYAMEYDGNFRRILTMAVMDAADSM